MKPLIFIGLLMWAHLIAANAGTNNRNMVVVLNKQKQVIAQDEFVWLSAERVGIPATLYKKLGIGVKLLDNRQIAVRDEGCGVVVFHSNKRYVEYPSNEKPLENIGFRSSLVSRGRFYVSAYIVQKNFPEYFVSRWNPKSGTLFLQKSN